MNAAAALLTTLPPGDFLSVLQAIEKPRNPAVYLGAGELGSNRNVFGEAVVKGRERPIGR